MDRKIIFASDAAEAVSKAYNIPLHELVDVFGDVPTVSVFKTPKFGKFENEKGVWLTSKETPGLLKCSVCNAILCRENDLILCPDWVGKNIDTCPNCGADMRGTDYGEE